MRTNIMPGDMLIAQRTKLCTAGRGTKLIPLAVHKGDRLFVVASMPMSPSADGDVYVVDPDLIEGFYPDMYQLVALWRDQLVTVTVETDRPFCDVIR